MYQFGKDEKPVANKFAALEKNRSKTEALRNRLIGLWVAQQIGKTGTAAEAYVIEVLKSDMQEPGDHDVLRKIYADLHAAGISVTEAEVRSKLDECYREAKKQMKEGA